MSKNELAELLKEEGYVMEVKGNILTITVDLSHEEGISSSGKSMVIASSHGNQPIGATGAKIGLNVYKPVKKTKNASA